MASSKSKPVSMKRLAQLLEEQQEPFKLEVYLSERRYAKKSSNRTCSHKMQQRIAILIGSKILKSAINMLISYKNCQKAVHCREKALKDRGKQASRTAKKQQHNAVRNFSSSSSSEEDAEACPLPSQSTFQALKLHNLRDVEVATNTKLQWGYMKDSKQLSPVTVLQDLPSDEAKQEETKQISGFTLPRKAKEDTILSAYLCELLVQSLTEKQNQVSKTELPDVKPKQVPMQTKQLLFNCVKEAMDSHGRQGRRQRSTREGLGPEEFGQVICEQICSLGKQFEDVKNINQLIDLNLSGTTEEWRNFQRWSKEIGKVIADAVLDDIVTEIINFEVYGY